MFYNIARYNVDFQNQKGIYYKDEYKSIEDKIIFSLKRNNFVDYLIDQSIDPIHSFKKQKTKISAYKKKKVWENEFGENKEGRCPISFCNTLLINKKGVGGWQCGHIISEYNGGETEVKIICDQFVQVVINQWDQKIGVIMIKIYYI